MQDIAHIHSNKGYLNQLLLANPCLNHKCGAKLVCLPVTNARLNAWECVSGHFKFFIVYNA
jgi:hypothetical protein